MLLLVCLILSLQITWPWQNEILTAFNLSAALTVRSTLLSKVFQGGGQQPFLLAPPRHGVIALSGLQQTSSWPGSMSSGLLACTHQHAKHTLPINTRIIVETEHQVVASKTLICAGFQTQSCKQNLYSTCTIKHSLLQKQPHRDSPILQGLMANYHSEWVYTTLKRQSCQGPPATFHSTPIFQIVKTD